MKRHVGFILWWVIIFASPAYSDYSSLNKAFDAYELPRHTADSPTAATAMRNPEENTQKMLSDKINTTIEKLKADQESRLDKQPGIPFLKVGDNETFSEFFLLSRDENRVAQTIKHKVVLSQIEIMAALRNPAILSAKKRIAAEIESFSQVMALDENLRQYTAFSEDLAPKAGPIKMKELVKLKYPYPGITSLKGQVINHQVSILNEKMEIIRKQVITDIRKAFWQLVFINTSKKITRETIDAFNRLKDVATILYKSGKTSFQDVIKINIKLAVLQEDLITLAEQKKNIDIRILELLNLPGHYTVGSPVFQNPYKETGTPDDLFPLARQNRNELKVIRQSIKKTEKMIEIAETMIQEPFTFNFSLFEDEAVKMVGTDAEKQSFPEKTMAAMQNNLPSKPWYGMDDPWLKGTQQTLSSLEQTLVSAEYTTDRMVQEAWFQVDKNYRELLLYEKQILSLSQSALEVTTREYESGSIPFSEAIDSYTSHLQVQLIIGQKQTELGIRISQLENIVGISF